MSIARMRDQDARKLAVEVERARRVAWSNVECKKDNRNRFALWFVYGVYYGRRHKLS